jgi:hypothetical protein
MLPRIWFCVVFIALADGCTNKSLAAGKEDCPVTKASDRAFVPPAPYRTMVGSGGFVVGTLALWTVIGPHSRVQDLSKLPYFRQGYDWMKEKDPRLTVVARRLDGQYPMVWNGWANNGNASVAGGGEVMFMVTGLDIPAAGCWEIAAHYVPSPDNIQTLTYTVWVEP